MNQRSNSCFIEPLLESIASGMADHEKMPNRFSPIWHRWNRQAWHFLQFGEVTVRHFPTAVIPFIQLLQFHTQERSLHLVEAGIIPLAVVEIFLPGAVIAQ